MLKSPNPGGFVEGDCRTPTDAIPAPASLLHLGPAWFTGHFGLVVRNFRIHANLVLQEKFELFLAGLLCLNALRLLTAVTCCDLLNRKSFESGPDLQHGTRTAV